MGNSRVGRGPHAHGAPPDYAPATPRLTRRDTLPIGTWWRRTQAAGDRRLLAFLGHAVERLLQTGEDVGVGRRRPAQRRRLDDQLAGMLQRGDEFRLVGRVLDPGVGAFGDEVEIRRPHLGHRGRALLHGEAHDDRDLVVYLLGGTIGDEDVGRIVLDLRVPVLRRGEGVAGLALAFGQIGAPVAEGRDLHRLVGLGFRFGLRGRLVFVRRGGVWLGVLARLGRRGDGAADDKKGEGGRDGSNHGRSSLRAKPFDWG